MFELNREFPANTSSIKPGIIQFNRDFILHLFINREKSASEKKRLRYRGGLVTGAPESWVSDKKGNGRGQKSCCLSTNGPVVKTNGALTSKKVSWTLDTLHVLNSHPLNSPLHLVCKHLERKGGEGVFCSKKQRSSALLSVPTRKSGATRKQNKKHHRKLVPALLECFYELQLLQRTPRAPSGRP